MIEWAVLESAFRAPRVVKGGLGSREEAEAWKAAYELTTQRLDYKALLEHDSIVSRGGMYVASREIGGWK